MYVFWFRCPLQKGVRVFRARRAFGAFSAFRAHGLGQVSGLSKIGVKAASSVLKRKSCVLRSPQAGAPCATLLGFLRE